MFILRDRPLQRVPVSSKSLFLSFDDGPTTELTPKVLDLLDEYEAKATFFVVGEKAKENPAIVEDLLRRGHALGDHSSDHHYSHFFRSKDHLKKWVSQSRENLHQQFGVWPVGFRSPAGVETPPLREALRELSIPWWHWKHRFFDTRILFSEKRFQKKLPKIQAGDIILLHDAQRESFREPFLKALSVFISQLKDKGFDFHAMSDEKFANV